MRILKVKLYPTAKQKDLLRQFLGNVRFVWNKLVEMKIYGFNKAAREIIKLKEKYEFLKLSPAQTLQQTARKLNQGYLNYKKGYTNKPSLKKRKNFDGILIFPQHFRLEDGKINIPKLGWINFKDKICAKDRFEYIQKYLKQLWIKEEPNGFFAFLVFDDRFYQYEKENDNSWIGVDVGLKNTITLSNGEKFRLDKKDILKIAWKIERLQSVIDKKKNINKKRGIKNSKRLWKLQLRKLKLFKKIQNMKDDFYHKVVNHILNSHEYVVVEDLNLNKLIKKKTENKKRDKAIHKELQYISLGRFFEILKYKADKTNCKIIKVNPFNTSRQCSNCGWINENLNLSNRVFKCKKCGIILDRDINAARNILHLGRVELNGREMAEIAYTPTSQAMEDVRILKTFSLGGCQEA